MNRRDLLKSSSFLAAIGMLGIKPEQVLAAGGRLLKVRMEADIQVLDPGYMIGGAETTIQFACLPRLAVPVKKADAWGWAPSDYVEKITQDDPTHISFTLKPGLMWSGDGGEVTAEDVKFSFERMLKSDWAARFPTLEQVDVKDKLSGVIVLKSPFAATFLMGIASESGIDRAEGRRREAAGSEIHHRASRPVRPLHDGRVDAEAARRAQGQSRLEGHASPHFPEVQFINVEDTKAAELAFEAGEVDITDVLPETAARYRDKMPAGAKLENLAGPYYTWIGLNTQHEKLKDIRVRKAIQRAIDVKSILDAAYGGIAPVAHGIVPMGVTGHRTASKYSYNPDEARALLAEAGVSDLTLEFKTLNEAYRVTAAQIVQANLADVGIKLEIIPLDSGPFWNLGLESKGEEWKTLQMWWMRYRTSPDPSDGIQWFVKSQVGVWNWERWSDPEFEELWTKGLAEPDKAKREPIYLRMQEIMEDTGAYVWITHDPLNYAHSTKIVPGFDTGGEVLVENVKKA